jgi:hypothetical protein
MHTDDVRKTTVVEAASLVERLSRVSKELTESNLQATAVLQSTTRAVPDLLRQAAQQTLGQLSAETAQSVRQGLHEPLDGFNRQVIDNINCINGVTHGLTQAQERVAAVVGKLTWLVTGVLATMLLIVLVGGGVLWHYHSVIAESRIQADLMRAYNRADVNLCGGQLCARVDRADKRYGDYMLVRPR